MARDCSDLLYVVSKQKFSDKDHNTKFVPPDITTAGLSPLYQDWEQQPLPQVFAY